MSCDCEDEISALETDLGQALSDLGYLEQQNERYRGMLVRAFDAYEVCAGAFDRLIEDFD